MHVLLQRGFFFLSAVPRHVSMSDKQKTISYQLFVYSVCHILVFLFPISVLFLGVIFVHVYFYSPVCWFAWLCRNGDAYAGEYFADKMHGFGVYHFGNGHRYEGAWHEGKRQGFGIYTFRTAETQSGHWQNGILNVSTSLGALPGSPSAVDHSKVLHAVQVII